MAAILHKPSLSSILQIGMRKRILTFALLVFHNWAFGQNENRSDCKIEIYLLKTIKPNLDTSKTLQSEFSVSKDDLTDTPFIRDLEIISYVFLRDTSRGVHGQNIVEERHGFKVNSNVTKRVNNLKIPLCCGRQFAVVVNSQVAYAGYFWNLRSSFGSDWITAFSYGKYIELRKKLPDLEFPIDPNDPRKNQTLFNCLISTNRLTPK